TVLAVRRGYRGCALPVAWTGVATPAQQAGRRAVSCTWTILGREARGVAPRGVGRGVTRAGGRRWCASTRAARVVLRGAGRGGPWQPLGPAPGTTWQGTGLAFQGGPRQRHGPLLACGEAEEKEPWVSRTARPPEASPACGEGWRAWIEQGCTSTKRAGW